jgi:DNA-binding NtrC family response regulator
MSERVCLIVDDEPAIRTYLTVVVKRKGFQSLEAESAVAALRMLQKLGGRIDLLITDIQMPGELDGMDLAYSAKNSFSTLPVILVSGNLDRVPAGFTFIRKPFMPEEILEVIDRTLHRSEAQKARVAVSAEVPEANPAGLQ